MDLVSIGMLIDQFSSDRDWEQFHSPRNLILAIVGEVGELAELVQWVPDSRIGELLSDQHFKKQLEEELADVIIYALRLASVCEINTEEAVLSKIKQNAEKYPIEKAMGRSEKYNQLEK